MPVGDLFSLCLLSWGGGGIVGSVGVGGLSFVAMFMFLSVLFMRTRRTGCMFCFVKSKVNIGRILKARVCHKRLRNGVNIAPLLFARFPCTAVTAAFSTAGKIASSTTTKATLTAKGGAGGNTLNIGGSLRAGIGDITS